MADDPDKFIEESLRKLGVDPKQSLLGPSQSSSPPTVPTMPWNEKLFWIALTIFGTGLYVVIEVSKYGMALIVLGSLGLAWSAREHVPKDYWRFATIIIVMVVTWIVVGYDIYDRHISPLAPASPAPAATSVASPLSRTRADPILIPVKYVPVLRNRDTGDPFFVNVFFAVNTNVDVTDVTAIVVLFPTKAEVAPAHMDQSFRALRAALDVNPTEYNVEYPAHTVRQISATASFFNDHDVEQVKNGDENLYVLGIWKYRLGTETIYTKELCVFFTGTLDNTKICPGQHNGTYKDG